MAFLKKIFMENNKQNNSKKFNIRRLEVVVFTIIITASIVAGILLGVLIASVNTQIDIAGLENYKPTIPTKIYDINNELVGEIFSEQREPITYNELPPYLIDAFVAVEDNNFFTHAGIDIFGMFRALFANITSMSLEEGASTITQQLARTVFDRIGRKKTIFRKLLEIWVSMQIERKYTKKEILTLYFNEIFLGHSAYGIQAASKFYFNKKASDMNLAECALLATLPKSPNRYSPINNVNLSASRHKLVLSLMVRNKFITKEQAQEAYTTFWTEYRHKIRNKGTTVYMDMVNKAPYFVEHVRRIVVSLYGEKRIKEEGLKIYTTLDLRKQKIAQEELKRGLDSQNKFYEWYSRMLKMRFERDLPDVIDMASLLFNVPLNPGENKIEKMVKREVDESIVYPLYQFSLIFGLNKANAVYNYAAGEIEESGGKAVEGALISINPANGYIVAMVGGSGFSPHNQLNRATQIRRQAGSAFKPFLYSYAINSRKFTVASIMRDSPVAYPTKEGNYWTPNNYSGTHAGNLRLREALKMSVNVISVKLLDSLGIINTIEFAKPIFRANTWKLEKRFFPRDLTLALGTGLFSPLELATGFAVLANRGLEVEPISILRVTDRYGVVIDDFEKKRSTQMLARGGKKQVISEEAAFIVTDMLRDVLRPGGTAYGAMRSAGFDREAAGKTGTSSAWKDAWFCGFTPQLVTAIWMGFDNYEYSLGRHRAGGVISAPVWAEYMKKALSDSEEVSFKRPENIVRVRVCAKSGMLPTSQCERVVDEYFIRGSSPLDFCESCSAEKEEFEEGTKAIDKIFERQKNIKRPGIRFDHTF